MESGTWTSKGFIYKPILGARGIREKTSFDSGMELVDARLGKETWVGDPGYGSSLQEAIAAVGSAFCTLRVPAVSWLICLSGTTLLREIMARAMLSTSIRLPEPPPRTGSLWAATSNGIIAGKPNWFT